MTPNEALHEISIKAHQYTDDIKMIISKDCYKEIVNALEQQIPKNVTHEATVYISVTLARNVKMWLMNLQTLQAKE